VGGDDGDQNKPKAQYLRLPKSVTAVFHKKYKVDQCQLN
jgi:hypothetical protein